MARPPADDTQSSPQTGSGRAPTSTTRWDSACAELTSAPPKRRRRARVVVVLAAAYTREIRLTRVVHPFGPLVKSDSAEQVLGHLPSVNPPPTRRKICVSRSDRAALPSVAPSCRAVGVLRPAEDRALRFGRRMRRPAPQLVVGDASGDVLDQCPTLVLGNGGSVGARRPLPAADRALGSPAGPVRLK